jgi:energy-coupling factor transport system substrate-specific component
MERFSTRLLALIPLAVGINLAMGQFVAVTHLPLFLDTVGTVLVAALAGPWAAVAAGILSQTVFTVLTGNLIWMWFLPVQIGVALYAGYAARAGVFRSLQWSAMAGLGLGVLAATMSWPISYVVFGGVTAGGVTVVTTVLTGLGVPLKWAVYAASLGTDLLDKFVTFLLVRTLLVSLPTRMASRFPLAARALGRA